MKIIDLLNKIANGEEVPERIKIGTHIFTRFDYSKGDGTYISSYQSDDGLYFIQDYSYPQDLNKEVEIIEDKKIEKIDELNNESDEFKVLRKKVNEIIDEIIKLKEGK